MQQAVAALKTDPSNPAANLFVGRTYCFTRGDWQQGLSHLAKGSDSTLAALAQKDVKAPADPNAQVELADGWWDASEAREGKEQEALKLRAGHWYKTALPNLPVGLTKAKVEKRLADIPEIEAPGPAKPAGI